MNSKSVPKTKLLASLAILAILGPMLLAVLPVSAAPVKHDPSWYLTVDGVLSSDYYKLYPYEKNPLSVGFSKFGELISWDETNKIGVGLQYPGYEKVGTYDQKSGTSRDPFANENIGVQYWLNGWFLDARYTHRTLGDRHVWAFAMFADMMDYGSDWLNESKNGTYGAPYGGRKTNKVASSEALKVLYNGPRRFIAQAVTHIYDKEVSTWPLLDVVITIDFNKDKKIVTVFKDVKLTIDSKILETPVDVQFSNRQEWDLGPTPDYKSYAHFMHQERYTCYGGDWTLVDRILREYIHTETATANQVKIVLPEDLAGEPYYVYPVIQMSDRVYINGKWLNPKIDYTIDYATGVITLAAGLKAGDAIKVYYKLQKALGTPDSVASSVLIGVPHNYDLCQVISSDKKYVGFAAYWPTLSDYTPDGWAMTLDPLYDVDDEDILPFSTEPDIPFLVGEWDFMLDYVSEFPNWRVPQFRAVTIYGVVNRHDGADEHFVEGGTGPIVPEREMNYLLDEVFNPWDLVSAVHKKDNRWVEYLKVPSTAPYRITLTKTPATFVKDSMWDQYCVFSERVEDLDSTGKPLLLRGLLGTDYSVSYNSATGKMTLTFASKHAGKNVKILYSTGTDWSRSAEIPFEFFDMNTGINATNKIAGFYDYDYETWTDPLAVKHRAEVNDLQFTATLVNTEQNFTATFTDVFYGWERNFKVFKDSTYQGSWDYGPGLGLVYSNVNVSVALALLDIHWWITAPEFEDVHVWNLGFNAELEIFIKYSSVTDVLNITASVTLTPASWYAGMDTLYSESIPGRYEWVTVGMHSRAIDSAGASLVSAAFKNKQVEIGLAALDMADATWGPNVPNLLYKLGQLSNYRAGAPSWTNYYDAKGRLTLKDDWCSGKVLSTPISSSNIITVGGGPANLVTEYFNEFTSAIFVYGSSILSEKYMDKIWAVPCWSMKAYGSGYAVIATYKDINGTVGFLVYGYTGDDTFYASKWFHETGIYYLQTLNDHVTAIILKIDYTKHPPAVSVVEHLGTISEKEPIHPDP